MPIELACDRCARVYSFRDEQAGMHFKCQVCGKLLRVPVPVIPLGPEEAEGYDEAGEESGGTYEISGGVGGRAAPPPLPSMSMPPPPPPPLPPPPPGAMQWPADVEARPVPQGEFWKGMLIPLAAVAVFVIATGAYGIYARSVAQQRATARAVAKSRQAPTPAPVNPVRRNVPRSTPPSRTPPAPMPPSYRPPGASPAVGSPVDVSKLPQWSAADVTGLGPAVNVAAYSIRPPASWTASGSSGGASRMWMGQRGMNAATSPRMSVAISPRTDRTRRELPAVVTRAGEPIPSGSGRVIYAPGGSVEYGTVNGTPVAKVTFAEPGTRRRVQYGAFHGENYIFVDAWYDARDTQAPRLIDSAVRTLTAN